MQCRAGRLGLGLGPLAPVHESLGGDLAGYVAVELGEPPCAGVLDGLQAEGSLSNGDDEAALLQGEQRPCGAW